MGFVLSLVAPRTIWKHDESRSILFSAKVTFSVGVARWGKGIKYKEATKKKEKKMKRKKDGNRESNYYKPVALTSCLVDRLYVFALVYVCVCVSVYAYVVRYNLSV